MKPRVYPRFYFAQPLHGYLQILEYKGVAVNSRKQTSIQVLDMGLGGVCFVSILHFPSEKDLLVKITFHRQVVTGYIAWRERKPYVYTYGLELTSSTVSFLQINSEFWKKDFP